MFSVRSSLQQPTGDPIRSFKCPCLSEMMGLRSGWKLIQQNESFIEQRKNFEDFIFENDIAVQRIIDTYRRGLQSARHISDYYVCVLNLFASGKTSVEVQESILANPKYQRLKLTFSPELEVTTGAFNSGNKSEVYIQEAYKKAPRCAICGGLLHTHSISIDHIQRKRDGGLGCVENGQLTHPYCNTGVKN